LHLFTASTGTRNAILTELPFSWVAHSSVGFVFLANVDGTIKPSETLGHSAPARGAPARGIDEPTGLSLNLGLLSGTTSALSTDHRSTSLNTAVEASTSTNRRSDTTDVSSEFTESLDLFWTEMGSGLATVGADSLWE
jgi:hypothetical protein